MRRAPVTYLRFAVLAAALGLARAPLVAQADNNDGTIVIPRPGVEAVSMPPVEAAGLCRHADHAVDLSTGNADITYRLCSLEGEGIEAAVTLRYRTGGVKQEDEPGITGLGWSLDWGGSITREVRGRPDGTAPLRIYEKAEQVRLDDLKGIINYTLDSDLDLYTYSAGPYSGRFVIEPDGDIRQLPLTDARIERSGDGFAVTAPDGTLYRFEPGDAVEYQFRPNERVPDDPSPDYANVVTGWRLTRIVNPCRTDSLAFSYAGLDKRDRYRRARLMTFQAVSKSGDRTPKVTGPQYPKGESAHRYTYTGRALPSEISGRFGKIRLSGAQFTVGLHKHDVVKGIELLPPGGSSPVRSVVLDYAERRGSLYLDGFTVSCGGVAVDGAKFGYFDDVSEENMRDLFGFRTKREEKKDSTLTPIYPVVGVGGGGGDENSKDGNKGGHVGESDSDRDIYPERPGGTGTSSQSSNRDCESAIDQNFRWSDERAHSLAGCLSGSLRSVTSMAGAVTEYEFESNTCPKYSFFPATIGARVKSETVTDHNTGVTRRREFRYEESVATFDLDELTYRDYVSQSGVRGAERTSDLGANIYMTTGLTFVASCRLPGASPESAAVYHGKVTETLTGTGLDSPVITVYEYDVTNVERNKELCGEWSLGMMDDYAWRGFGFGYGIQTLYASSGQQLDPKLRSLFEPMPVAGYFRERYGDSAPLRRVTRKRIAESGDTIVTGATERYYTRLETCTLAVGLYSELMARRLKRADLPDDRLDARSVEDFQRFPVMASAYITVCDSVVAIERGDDGSERRMVTRYEYPHRSMAKGIYNPQTGLFDPFFLPDHFSFPSKVTTECGGETASMRTVYPSDEREGIGEKLFDQWRVATPLRQVMTHGGLTAVKVIDYAQYGSGNPFNIRPKAERLHVGDEAKAVAGEIPAAARLDILGYDGRGNPTAARSNNGPTVSYGWSSSLRLPVSVTVGGMLTTKYDHIPLVGPKMVTDPAGTKTSYAYEGGRLSSVSVDGHLTAEYEYGLRGFGHGGRNQIVARTMLDGGASLSSVSVLDAYGREYVSSIESASGRLASAVEYDALGRAVRSYLAAPIEFAGVWNPDSSPDLFLRARGGDSRPFAETAYAPGESRPVSSTAPGEEYAGHPARFRRLFNARAAEAALSCRRYTAPLGGGSLTLSGDYPEGSLEIAESVDPDGRTLLEFTDFRGRKVLSRRLDGSAMADTYYVYDDADNLVYALQPMASGALSTKGATWADDDPTLKACAFSNRYDGLLRLVSERSPGAEPKEYFRDATGAAVLTADGLDRERGVMRLAAPDSCGRPAVTALCPYDRALASSLADKTVTARYVGAGSASAGETLLGGYAVNIGKNGCKLLDAVYYDNNYAFLAISGGLGESLGLAALKAWADTQGLAPTRKSSFGLATGGVRALLNPDYCPGGEDKPVEAYLPYAVRYDGRGRVDLTVSAEAGGGFSYEAVVLSNTGNPLSRSVKAVTASGAMRDSVGFAYSYDGFDRLVSTSVTRGVVAKTVAADTYDSFGRVSRTALGPSGVAVDYTHTLAGAVRTITAPEFAQTLLRTEGKNPLWGGGISANLWRGADGIARRYDYAFDGFGRLTAADYSESGRPDGSLASGSPAADYSCAYAYDLNSNPTSIVRRGVTRKSTPLTVVPKSLTITMPVAPTTYTFGLIDDLSLVRDGNKLHRVDDGADSLPIYAGAPDFPDGVGDSLEYEYDPNGNLTRDDNRGYTAAYNLLNLPAHIKGDDGTIIRNYYDTSGTLLRREVTTPNVSKNPITGGNTTMMETVTDDYVGDLVFVSNNKPKIKGEPDPTTIRVVTPTGFIDTAGKVHSHVCDYQGNVRQVLDEEGNVEQSSDYYPYGMLMGESDLSATSASPNPFRFGGKHYLTAASVFLHDFAARFYDAALITFTSHDPFAAKYTQFSPILYCGADPINYIDPTGCEIVYSTSDPAEIARFMECVKWLQKSPIFDMAYSILSDSFNNYEVNLGLNPDAAEAANFTENKSGLGGVINFKIGVYEFATICEEFFHALQSELKNGITEKDQNFEFEARVFIAAVDISSPTGVGGTTYPARAAVNNVTELFMDNDNQGLIFDAMFKVGTPEFHSEYIKNATVYAKENIKKNYGNQHYKVIPKYGPQTLIRLLSMLYFKY